MDKFILIGAILIIILLDLFTFIIPMIKENKIKIKDFLEIALCFVILYLISKYY